MMNEKTQLKWLNCSKAFATLAVITDHTNQILYSNQDIAYASYFSVSLFILIAGITSYMSNENKVEKQNKGFIASYLHSIKKIVYAYLISVAVQMFFQLGYFNFVEYLNYVIHFNISGSHYFVLLYIQIMLANTFLFRLLKKCDKDYKGYTYEFIILIVITVFASWSTNYSNILNVYGAGGKLLGATCLILYYLGMLIAKHECLKNSSLTKNITVLCICGFIYFFYWRFVCENGLIIDSYLPFGTGGNPPGISFSIFALCMLGISFGLVSILERNKYTKIIVDIFSKMGRYTLYIFLYHLLILNSILEVYFKSLISYNIGLATIVYFAFMIVIPILIQLIISRIQKFIVMVMKN